MISVRKTLNVSKHVNKLSAAGILVALGIIYGDIGTSPLYVYNSIIKNWNGDRELIIGTLSLIIWTLTFQTTIKYVLLVLRADNKGEGGIFALFALVRRRRKWLVIPAMIGGASLLADGMITPPISITSAIEGLKKLPVMHNLDQLSIEYVVLAIMSIFFISQQFGTASIGKIFGPVMSIWFLMLAVLGVVNITKDFSVLEALNPYHALHFLITYPGGFWLLGAVFLCTTGAEALYSDLGHCGRSNIRISWIFVKTCLLLNYFGQAANLLKHKDLALLKSGVNNPESLGWNAFYDLMPQWFIVPGIIVATTAAIIASQALVSGSFTLINEAIRLNLWPRLKVKYPSEAKGQIYIPGINTVLFIGCISVVLYFKESAKMEAAYGLAIITTMIMTTILFANFMVLHRVKPAIIYLFISVYVIIEAALLVALLDKFIHGGFLTLLIGFCMFAVMYIWYRARKIKNRYIEFVRVEEYVPKLEELSNDTSVPKYATHLVYLTSANNHKEIEHKIMFSILSGKPKRADIYWFVHVDTLDEPYTSEYTVEHIIPNDIIRVEFRLGFRVAPRIHLMFKKVVEDLVANREVNVTSRYESQQRHNVVGDFEFIVMEKFLSQDNELPFIEKVYMQFYFWLKEFSLSEERGFGLDQSNVRVEKFPLIVSPVSNLKLKRIYTNDDEV